MPTNEEAADDMDDEAEHEATTIAPTEPKYRLIKGACKDPCALKFKPDPKSFSEDDSEEEDNRFQ